MFPFLIKQMGSPPAPTVRYQQVYDASLFANIATSSIYVTSLTFFIGANFVVGWTIPSMQINVSTTAKTEDGLSQVFSDNVGADDAVVFGPSSYSFPGGSANARQLILFDRPFRYSPTTGNLLVEVRIFDGTGPLDPRNPMPVFDAYQSTTDQVSRVWATNVSSTASGGMDSLGLTTVVQMSPIPVLQAQFYPLYAGTQTNILKISWPSQPSVFVLQTTAGLGPGASWRNVTNQVFGNPAAGGRWIELPSSYSGMAGYYRLIWTSGP
jgi:hypothetical protein